MRDRFAAVEAQSQAALAYAWRPPLYPAAERADGTDATPGAIVIALHGRDKAEVAKARKRAKRGKAVFEVEISQARKPTAVAPLLEELSRAGTVRPVVSVKKPPRVPIPTPEAPVWTHDVLADLEATKSSSVLAAGLKSTLGTCRPLADAFDLSNATHENFAAHGNFAAHILGKIPEGVRACGCGSGVDVDALELFTIMTTMLFERGRGWIEVRFDPAGEPVTSPDRVDQFVKVIGELDRSRRAAGVRWTPLEWQGP